MTTWDPIIDAQTATGAIITQQLMRALQYNIKALAEDDASVPLANCISTLGRQTAVTVLSSLMAVGGSASSVATPGVGLGNNRIISWKDAAGLYTNSGFIWFDSANEMHFGAQNATKLSLGAALAAFASGVTVTADAFGTTGTFTPSLVGTGGTSAHTYTFRQGRYWKIGKMVHFTIRVTLSAKDAGMTGAISISGLPFAVITTDAFGAVIPYLDGYTFAGFSSIGGYLGASQSSIALWKMGSGTTVAVHPADVGGVSNIFLSGTYETP